MRLAVDGDQAVAGPDAGFGGGSMRGDAIDENGHGFFSKASEIGGAADKNGKMTRRGPQAGLCPVKAADACQGARRGQGPFLAAADRRGIGAGWAAVFEENKLLRYFALKKDLGAPAKRKTIFLVQGGGGNIAGPGIQPDNGAAMAAACCLMRETHSRPRPCRHTGAGCRGYGPQALAPAGRGTANQWWHRNHPGDD